MSSREFADTLEAAFRAQGHEVRRLQRGGADFELTLRQRRSVVAFKRWKAANLGVEPLRELQAAQRELDADAALLVATGVLSEKAADLVRDNPLQLLGADVADLETLELVVEQITPVMHRAGKRQYMAIAIEPAGGRC